MLNRRSVTTRSQLRNILRRKFVSNETYSGSFYCVKCKDHREAEGAVSVNEKGTRIAKAKCPVCGTNLTRFLPKK